MRYRNGDSVSRRVQKAVRAVHASTEVAIIWIKLCSTGKCGDTGSVGPVGNGHPRAQSRLGCAFALPGNRSGGSLSQIQAAALFTLFRIKTPSSD